PCAISGSLCNGRSYRTVSLSSNRNPRANLFSPGKAAQLHVVPALALNHVLDVFLAKHYVSFQMQSRRLDNNSARSKCEDMSLREAIQHYQWFAVRAASYANIAVLEQVAASS